MPLLARPAGRHDRAVDVQVGDRAEQVPAAPGPQPGPDLVDRLHQFQHVGLGEAAAEVPGRRRVRDQVRTQGVHVRGVVAQPFDVFQPGATAQHVVRQVQHVIGLVVRQVHLQQMQPLVDPLGQPEPAHQSVHRRYPAEARRVHVGADLVAHLSRGQHRYRPRFPVPGLGVPCGHLPSTTGRVPPTLLMRYLLHHKGLSHWAALESQTQAG